MDGIVCCLLTDIRHTLIYCILKRGIVFYALIYADKLALSNSSATGLQIISTAPRCHPPINTTASFGEMDISFRNAFVFLSGNRLYFIARAHCISWMVWELFATPALELLPIIRCPHTHFFAESTIKHYHFFPKICLWFSLWKVWFQGTRGKCYCRTEWGETALVLNIVIFLQLYGGEAGTWMVPQRDVKTTNSRNSDEQQQELGNKNPSLLRHLTN